MTRKRLVQTYKPLGSWQHVPPGIGDFIRGTCHLFEHAQRLGVDLRIDVSGTGFAELIIQDPSAFQSGDPARIAAATEHFEDDTEFFHALDRFQRSRETELYVCSNMGAWDRPALPAPVREFAGKFYQFTAAVEDTVTRALPQPDFAVLSVRCGDESFDDPQAAVRPDQLQTVTGLIEREILPDARWPIVVISDSLAMKRALAAKYGFAILDHSPGHGARGDERPVALDLCVLKRARHSYHINAWTDWWSGFAHYTALIFGIPSTSFRAPRFARESPRSPRR